MEGQGITLDPDTRFCSVTINLFMFSDLLYVGTAINGLIELPGDLLGGLLMPYLGRRLTVGGSMLMY